MLVCCDNEGCIVDAKGRPFDLPALAELVATIHDSGWAFTICTGRSVPYVEAMVQLLNLLDSAAYCVCEGGSVLYAPRTDRYEALVDPVDADAIRAILPAGGYREELGKVVSYSAYPEPGYTVEALYDLVMSHNLGTADVTRSVAAVDVTPKGVDKSFGMGRMLDRLDAAWSEVLGIGDSWNDLPMLDAAGLAACPANAVPEVRAMVDYASPYEATRGVTDILRWARSR
jgi:hydroxymethylpyrimidine pyrophosphatase-like HAD family hydrolase